MNYILGKNNRTFYMGISMILIIGYHILLLQENILNKTMLLPFKVLFNHGYIGVDIFFFLSAYGLCYSFESNTYMQFLKKRVLRIYPTYTFFLIICCIFFIQTSLTTCCSDSLLQLSSLSVFHTKYTNTSFMQGEWFTPAIINLYILFPLLYKITNTIAKKFKSNGQISLLFSTIILTHFLYPYISGLYITRLPIIIIGILTYINIKNNDEKLLILLYVSAALFSFCTERSVVKYSLIIPLILKGINLIQYIPSPNRFIQYINWIGVHSFELYLAQSICMALCVKQNCYVIFIIMTIGVWVISIPFIFINNYIKRFKL